MSARRVVLGLGAGLLLGGFGMTRLAHTQQAAADEPSRWWHDGLVLNPRSAASAPSMWERRAAPSDGAGTAAGSFTVAADPSAAPAKSTRLLWPSKHLSLGGLAAMVAGAGLLGLALPRGSGALMLSAATPVGKPMHAAREMAQRFSPLHPALGMGSEAAPTSPKAAGPKRPVVQTRITGEGLL